MKSVPFTSMRAAPLTAATVLAAALLLATLIPVSGAEQSQGSVRVEKALKKVTLSGYTRSRTKMTVSSEVAGKVLQVNYDVGKTIGKQPFIEIDATFIDFQIEQIEISLKKLSVVKSRSTSRMTYLEKEYQRIAHLRRSDVTSESRYDAAAEELTQARLELESTNVEIASLQTQLKELRERRGRHRIYAPQGWIVVERKVEAGEIIATGSPLAQVADYTQLAVPLFVSAGELAALERKREIVLSLEGAPVKAAINWINPEFDERTRKLAVELIIPAYDGPRRGGLLAELSLDIEIDGLMVPKSAVSDLYENPRVTLKSNGRSIPVVILGESGGHVLIAKTGELAPGMELAPKP
jgi:RND family efflux transporter MFP subunit